MNTTQTKQKQAAKLFVEANKKEFATMIISELCESFEQKPEQTCSFLKKLIISQNFQKTVKESHTPEQFDQIITEGFGNWLKNKKAALSGATQGVANMYHYARGNTDKIKTAQHARVTTRINSTLNSINTKTKELQTDLEVILKSSQKDQGLHEALSYLIDMSKNTIKQIEDITAIKQESFTPSITLALVGEVASEIPFIKNAVTIAAIELSKTK